MRKLINTGISNTYGCVTAYEDDGKYYLVLDDYDGAMKKEISKELYLMLDKEFKEGVINNG